MLLAPHHLTRLHQLPPSCLCCWCHLKVPVAVAACIYFCLPPQAQQYSPAWRSHVLAHLPFYTQLLPAFLELAYSQMAYCPRPALKEAYRVRGVVTLRGFVRLLSLLVCCPYLSAGGCMALPDT